MKLSVIIPVKNGSATLERCLQSISAQTLEAELEIIILNSMSTDNSISIAQKFNTTIIAIPDGSFDHGLTRNLGVAHAAGELIFFTVQDAWISSTDMLATMSRHFEDSDVTAVVGHQAVPHEKDKNPLLWFRPISKPSVTIKQVDSQTEFFALSQSRQQELIAWDNVVAMYRKTALTQQPFVQTAFAEDWIWSFNALLKGWKLLHDSSLVVYHYHHHTFQYTFRSQYTINYHFFKFFGYRPFIPALLRPVGQSVYHLLKNRHLSMKEKIYWISHNVVSRVAAYFSTLDFIGRLKTWGEKGVEKGFRKYCRIIPQGSQKD